MAPRTAPDPELIRLGAGEAFFDPWDANGASTGMRHLGNLDALEITTTPDILLIRSNMTRTRPVRKKINRSTEVTLRCVGDEWSIDNLALLTMGTKAFRTVAATPVADKILFADVPAATLGAALGGRHFYVGDLNIGTVSMDLDAASLVEDTDWELYSAHMGLVRILPGSTVATDGADDLTVTYTPQAITGTNSPVIYGATKSEIQGSFLFVEDNAAGENHIVRAWSVSSTPDGAFGLISEEKATFALNLTVQDDAAGLHGGTSDNPMYEMQLVPDLA